MTKPDPHQLWSDFLAAWPLARVRQMTLEEYTNASKDDAFIYWLEVRLDSLGNIWGGSAFKFGIYCRKKAEAKKASGGKNWATSMHGSASTVRQNKRPLPLSGAV